MPAQGAKAPVKFAGSGKGKVIVMISFVDEDGYYGFRIPAKRGKEEMLLKVWVGYQRGDEGNMVTWDTLERGFYLFLNLRQVEPDSYGESYMLDGKSLYKVLIKKVNRKCKRDAILSGKIAAKYLERMIAQCFPDITCRMEEKKGFTWRGQGTGVGIYSGFFVIEHFQFDGLEDEYTV